MYKDLEPQQSSKATKAVIVVPTETVHNKLLAEQQITHMLHENVTVKIHRGGVENRINTRKNIYVTVLQIFLHTLYICI